MKNLVLCFILLSFINGSYAQEGKYDSEVPEEYRNDVDDSSVDYSKQEVFDDKYDSDVETEAVDSEDHYKEENPVEEVVEEY